MTSTKAVTVLEALDAMGLALVEHHHQWTNAERKLYEQAVKIAKDQGAES